MAEHTATATLTRRTPALLVGDWMTRHAVTVTPSTSDLVAGRYRTVSTVMSSPVLVAGADETIQTASAHGGAGGTTP